jgi:hypothetical protein
MRTQIMSIKPPIVWSLLVVSPPAGVFLPGLFFVGGLFVTNYVFLFDGFLCVLFLVKNVFCW